MVNTDSAGSGTGTNASPRRGGSCLPWIILLLVLAGGGAVTAYVVGTFLLRQETVFEPEAAGADAAKRLLMIEPEYTRIKHQSCPFLGRSQMSPWLFLCQILPTCSIYDRPFATTLHQRESI